MCDITCTKHFLGSEGWDATPLFLFIHSSSCPPPQLSPSHLRGTQCPPRSTGPIRHRSFPPATGVAREHMRTMDSHLIWKFPTQNICHPSFTSKEIPTWVEGYFLKWNCFQLYIKLIQPFTCSLQIWCFGITTTNVQRLSRYLQSLKTWHHANYKMTNRKSIRLWENRQLHSSCTKCTCWYGLGIQIWITLKVLHHLCCHSTLDPYEDSKCPHPMGQEATINSANNAKRTRPDWGNTGTRGNIGRGSQRWQRWCKAFAMCNLKKWNLTKTWNWLTPFASLEVTFQNVNLLQYKLMSLMQKTNCTHWGLNWSNWVSQK